MSNLNQINGAEFGNPVERDYVAPVVEILDYVALAQSRLTSIFAEKPLIKALTGAMVKPLNDVESMTYSFNNERWIDTAIGKQLDGCGYIVGEPRNGRTDNEYRLAIKFRIFVNTSNATPEDLIQGLRFLTSPDNIQYIEQYPATAMLFTDGASPASTIHYDMQDLAPAAISELPIMVSYARNSPFRFGSESSPSELFINNDADYLTLNGADWQISSSEAVSGSRLGGVVPAELWLGGSLWELNDGSFLVINNPETDILLDSGYHLTGLFT